MTDEQLRDLAAEIAGKTILSLEWAPDEVCEGGGAWLLTVDGVARPIELDSDRRETEIIGCCFHHGPEIAPELPPQPELAGFRAVFGPGSGVVVGDDGRIRLGPGSELWALPDGGMVISCPRSAPIGELEEMLRREAGEKT